QRGRAALGAEHPAPRWGRSVAVAADQGPQHPLLVQSENLRRRHVVNRAMEASAWVAAVLAVGVLALVVGSVAVKGISSINIDFLTKVSAPFGESGGGIANAIVGTGVIVGLATLMAVPMGILVAIYTSEFAGQRSGFAVRYVLDILNGVPTIVTGVFVYGILVAGHQQSAFAGSVALASLPLTIFQKSESPNPADHAEAWGAALLLIAFVLVISIAARVLSARTRRRLRSAR